MRSLRSWLAGFLAFALAVLSPGMVCSAKAAQALGRGYSSLPGADGRSVAASIPKVKTLDLVPTDMALVVPGSDQVAGPSEAIPAVSMGQLAAPLPLAAEHIRDVSAPVSNRPDLPRSEARAREMTSKKAESVLTREAASLRREVARTLDSAGPIGQMDPESARTLGDTLHSILTADHAEAATQNLVSPPPSKLNTLSRRIRLSMPLAAARASNAVSRWGVLGFVPMMAVAATPLSEIFASFSPMGKVGIYLFIGIPSLILHEVAHARVALMLGDTWPTLPIRASLRPLDLLVHKNPETGKYELTHMYPLWTLALPVALILMGSSYGIGLARPVRCGLNKYSSAMVLVALAGPAVNLAVALGVGLLHAALVAAGVMGFWPQMLAIAVWINLIWGLFNLLFVIFFDGHHVVRFLIGNKLKMPELDHYLFGLEGLSRMDKGLKICWHFWVLYVTIWCFGPYMLAGLEWLWKLFMLS